MKIEDNKVVHLTYQLKVDGEIADSATAEKPLQFIFGMGYLLPKFEENIAGKEVGDEFEFMLTAEQGYGLVNPSAIVDIPRSAFEIDGEFQEAYVQPDNSDDERPGRDPRHSPFSRRRNRQDGLQSPYGRQRPPFHRQG